MKSDFVQWLFNPFGLTPHGFCLLWEQGLAWIYAISDIAIGVAYFAIPFILLVFARRVLTIRISAYGLEAVFKAITGIVSLLTAFTLWRLMPAALALPSPPLNSEMPMTRFASARPAREPRLKVRPSRSTPSTT